MDPRPARRNRFRHPHRLVLLAAASIALVAACGSAASPAFESLDRTDRDGQGGPAAATAAPTTAGNAGAPTEGEAPPVPSQVDRLIIRTGQLSLRVKDLDASLAGAARQIEALGGYVAGSERQGEDEKASARVIYRIPAARWDEALAEVRKVGEKVLGEQTSSQEVTDQVVDLGARLVNLRTTEAALQKIMDRATKIPDILEVQGQLTGVREQIERLEAEKQNLEKAAAMATLTVDFTLPPPVAVAQVQEGWDPGREVDQAAATLVEMGQGAVNLGIWLVIVWLPILLVVGLVALVSLAITRRARRRPPLAPPPAPASDIPESVASG